MPEDYRPTEPVHSYEFAQVPPGDELPAPPPGKPRRSSLWWIAVVVAVFMAVPLLASLSTRTPVRARAPAASEPVAAAEPATEAPARTVPATVRAVQAPARAAPEVPDQAAPAPTRVLPEPDRQMVTKCVERGRVVYTQTGECDGSVSAVPIDPGKNVVGPARAAPRQ
ncbi:MAG TPA: hypothetical protein VFZ28_17810 [Burkholderiaceae bacterium]|nr:hypothetical protein [Burkholderiaceae bacterium]